jgi:hypothetical protein
MLVFLIPVLLHVVLSIFMKEPPLEEYFFICDLLFFLLAFWVFIVRGPYYVLGTLWREKPALRKLLLMFLAPSALLTVLFIPFSNPIGMRYFLVCYLLLMLGVIWLVGQLVAKRWRKWVLSFMGLALLSGHFWVYPDNIAKSWDSSLAHVPWFMMDDLAKGAFQEGEAEKQVLCTDFPMLASRKYSYVTDKPGLKWQDIKEMNSINQCDCVLWSNISNGFEGRDMQTLDNELLFSKRMSAQRLQVKVVLYKQVFY